MKNTIKVFIDTEADAAYIQLTEEEVATTKEVNESVIIDLDKFAMAVGIELLRIDAEIPFQKLLDEYHIHSAVIEKVRALRPSLSVQLQSASEGQSNTARSGEIVYS